MKIVFLCGSLEPGKDGVGDYTRRLACELIKQGHSTATISLNDKYVVGFRFETQNADGIEIEVLRISSSAYSNELISKAKNWIDKFNPDWVSLQYVPFSFQSKGLPFGLSKKLKEIVGSRKWHVMFHELWVGMDMQSPIKHTLWGMIQRRLIQSLVKKIRPLKIHTQTNLYQTQLRKLGFEVDFLPLFSNIKKVKPVSIKSIYPNFKSEIVFVIFGTIHSGAPFSSFATEIFEYACKKNIKITLVTIGRCGTELDNLAYIWRSKGLPIRNLGEHDSTRISEELERATIGIATTPLAQIEKSGSVAAMLEHGLPVICISKPWEVRNLKFDSPPGIYEYKPGNLDFILNELKGIFFINDISKVANDFEKDLLEKN